MIGSLEKHSKSSNFEYFRTFRQAFVHRNQWICWKIPVFRDIWTFWQGICSQKSLVFVEKYPFFKLFGHFGRAFVHFVHSGRHSLS